MVWPDKATNNNNSKCILVLEDMGLCQDNIRLVTMDLMEIMPNNREATTWLPTSNNNNNNSNLDTINNILDILSNSSNNGILMVRVMTRVTGANNNSTWAGTTV